MAVVKGAGALGALEAEQDSGEKAEFTPFKSGTVLKVRVKSTEDLARYYNYGVFKVVNSFTPAEPAERNGKGFIVEGTETPWDLAAKYHQDRANQARSVGDTATEDDEKEAARLYRGTEKYIVGFYDLESGKDIVIDLTRNQAKIVFAAIKKYSKKLDKLAFEISKSGSSTSTTVSFSPIIDMDEDLTDKERAAFDKVAGEAFNDSLFDGVLYEASKAEQVELLTKAGFDVSKIGLTAEKQAETDDGSIDIDEKELPF